MDSTLVAAITEPQTEEMQPLTVGKPKVKKAWKGNKGQLPDIISADFTKSSRYVWVPTDALLVDPFYQRQLQPGKISKMAHNWDPNLVGVFVVNRRAEGQYFVIDGQHRHAAIQRIESYPTHVYCEVFTGLTPAQEADLFYQLDTKRDNLTPAARFKALLASGNAAALEIKEVAEAAGFIVDPDKGNTYDTHHLRAFNSLLEIHRRVGRAGLARILTTASKSWPDRKDAGMEPLLKGLELFYQKYPNVNDERLVRLFTTTTPIIIVSSARRIQEDLSSVIYSAVGQTIRGIYNKQLQARNKLAAW